MKTWHGIGVLIVLAAAGFVYSVVTSRDIGGRSFTGEVMLPANPGVVWGILTDPRKLADISEEGLLGGPAKYAKIGDASEILSGADTGELVVTMIRQPREIRFAFEPRNGSYACQQSWVIRAMGDSSKVEFIERYTESGPETAAQVDAIAKEYNAMLGRLSRLIVGK